MILTLDRERVSSEYTGLARVFRSAVKAEDVALDKALDAITAPLRPRLKRHPKLRHEQIAGTVRLYGILVPNEFRIGETDIDRDRSAFSISETRLACSWQRFDEWQSPDARELGLAVARYRLALKDGRLRETWDAYAVVSLHAIARRIERGNDRSHSALFADLALLADAVGTIGDQVTTPDGFWLGGERDVRDSKGRTSRARSVRTWVAA
jgi:hypothetical protein